MFIKILAFFAMGELIFFMLLELPLFYFTFQQHNISFHKPTYFA